MRIRGSVLLAACCVAAVTVCALAASIPAWLDEAITGWNQKNPASQFQFLGIKDSYVWYQVQRTAEFGQKEIRDASYRLATAHGYQPTNDEELVTTGKPPSTNGPSQPKKCWKRSFVLTLGGTSNTTTVDGDHAGVQQRMLTSMVCEDGEYWDTGFRVLQ